MQFWITLSSFGSETLSLITKIWLIWGTIIMNGAGTLMQIGSTIWPTLLTIMTMPECLVGAAIGMRKKSTSKQPTPWLWHLLESLSCIMELNSTMQVEMTPTIGRYYGKTWTEIQKCIVSSLPLILPGKKPRYGINLKLKGTQTTSSIPILGASSSCAWQTKLEEAFLNWLLITHSMLGKSSATSSTQIQTALRWTQGDLMFT